MKTAGKRWFRLRTRLSLVMLAGVGVVTLIMAGMSYLSSSEALLQARQEQIFDLARARSAQLARKLNGISQPARSLAVTAAHLHPLDPEVVPGLLASQVKAAPGIFGMAMAFKPHALGPSRWLFAQYAFRSPQGLKTQSLASPTYNYLIQDWFQIPSLLARPIWSEPYFDEGGGNILMSTYSAPIIQKGQVQGVVTADMNLGRLAQEIRTLPSGEGGFAFLITHQGAFLAAPRPEWVMRETIFSLAEQWGRPSLRALGRRMVRGGAAVVRTQDWLSDRPAWLAFAPVRDVGWSLGVMTPEEEVLAPVWNLARRQLFLGTVGLVALVLVVWLVVMGLTRPLRRLAAGAARLASGDLSTRVENIPPGDEVGDLAQSFNQMVKDLSRYVDELTTTTKAKERIESELDLARQIQMSILPTLYPPFPDREEFDLHARSLPAREVGGDFFDFFFVDPDHLGLVMADVSGKGVGAALFMTVSRTLIKNAAVHHREPEQVLAEVNAQILPDNEMCMFVTVFYGVYQISTGQLRYTCAGHPPPLVRRKDGRVEQLANTSGMAVGIAPDCGLNSGQTKLEPEEALLLFTDGLDEAINPRQEMFGLERTAQWLAQVRVGPAPGMLDNLVDTWNQFTQAVEQFDDLTLMIFRRRQ